MTATARSTVNLSHYMATKPSPQAIAGFYLHMSPKNANIYLFAGIAKWSNASDCKSAGFGLRRFDSYSQHQEKILSSRLGIFLCLKMRMIRA